MNSFPASPEEMQKALVLMLSFLLLLARHPRDDGSESGVRGAARPYQALACLG